MSFAQETTYVPDKQHNLACTFAKLMFVGKTNAAIQLLSREGNGGILHPSDSVDCGNQETRTGLDILKSKHRCANQLILRL